MRLSHALCTLALTGFTLWAAQRARLHLRLLVSLRRPRRGGFDRLEGKVAAIGRVLAADLVDSPLGARRGVYVRCLVEERRESNVLNPLRGLNGGGSWHAVEYVEDAAPFWLCGDDGSRLLVDPTRALVLGLPTERGSLAGGLRRFEQAIIADGDELMLFGAIERRVAPEGERLYRGEATWPTLVAPGEPEVDASGLGSEPSSAVAASSRSEASPGSTEAGPPGNPGRLEPIEPDGPERIDGRLLMGPEGALERALRLGALGWSAAAVGLGLLATVLGAQWLGTSTVRRPACPELRSARTFGIGPNSRSTLESAYSTR